MSPQQTGMLMRGLRDAQELIEIQESRITQLEDQLNATKGQVSKARRVEVKYLETILSMQDRIDQLYDMVAQLIRRPGG